jgi:hypothetical protein
MKITTAAISVALDNPPNTNEIAVGSNISAAIPAMIPAPKR